MNKKPASIRDVSLRLLTRREHSRLELRQKLLEKSFGKEERDVSLRLLTRREHSRLELRQKLLEKSFGKEEIDVILDELAEQGWQNDARFAESYARHRIQQGFGPVAITYELRQKGIEGFDLDALAESMDNDWMALLHQLYQKKYPDNSAISRAEWAKRYRFLLQRGFPSQLLNDLPKQLPIKLS